MNKTIYSAYILMIVTFFTFVISCAEPSLKGVNDSASCEMVQAIFDNDIRSLKKELSEDGEGEKNCDSLKPVEVAAINGKIDVLHFLIDNGAIIDGFIISHVLAKLMPIKITDVKCEDFHSSALQSCLPLDRKKMVSVFTLLLDQANGVDLNAISFFNYPIHTAPKGGKELVDLFVKYGAKLDTQDPTGNTIFHFAAIYDNNEDLIEMLLASGYNVNIENKTKATPLHFAAYYGSFNNLKTLIEHGADVNKISEREPLYADDVYQYHTCLAPLHCAVISKDLTTAEILLLHDADINSCREKKTPLLLSVFQNKPNMVRLFIKNGADLDAKMGGVGMTPLDLAISLKRNEIITILREAK